MLRDDALDKSIPVFEPSDYDLKAKNIASQELTQLLSMTDEEKITYGQQEKAAKISMYEKIISTDVAQNNRLSDMRLLVAAWQPPTNDHIGLKDFMLKQIDISMGNTRYYEKELINARASFARDYYDDAVKKKQHDIEYHTKGNRQEIERTESRNRWIRELKASLPSSN